MTALGEKFERAGIVPREVRFNAALAEFLNNGGSVDRAHALIDAVADKMGSEGQQSHARTGQINFADASQPNESGGQRCRAVKADVRSPSLSPESSEGHTAFAGKAIVAVPSAAPKRNGAQRSSADKAVVVSRPVSPSYVAAAKQGAKDLVAKLGWIGEANIPGGPKFIDLRWRDIDGMVERQIAEGATHARAAIALAMIRKEGDKLGRVDPETLWTDTLPPETVKAISVATESETLKPMAVGWLKGLSNSVQEIADAR